MKRDSTVSGLSRYPLSAPKMRIQAKQSEPKDITRIVRGWCSGSKYCIRDAPLGKLNQTYRAPLIYQSSGRLVTSSMPSVGILKCTISGASFLQQSQNMASKHVYHLRCCIMRSDASSNEFPSRSPISLTILCERLLVVRRNGNFVR